MGFRRLEPQGSPLPPSSAGLRPIIVPLLVYLGAWTGLTAFGATIFDIFPTELRDFLGTGPLTPTPPLGGFDYWLMIITPYITVPVVAVVTFFLLRSISPPSPIKIEVGSGILFLVMLSSCAYCFYKLKVTGHLGFGFLSSAQNYAENIENRISAISDLRFIFYCLLYAVLPLTGTLFFSKWLSGGSIVDACGFLLNTALFGFLVLSIYMKAPFVIYVGLLAIAWTQVKSIKWQYLAIFAAAGLVVLIVAQVLQGTGSVKIGAVQGFEQAAVSAPKNIAFRMASAFPFYVAEGESSNIRCGPDTNHLPLLPRPRCDLASKIFTAMYPSITAVQGMAPAAAHVYDFAAAGLLASTLVLVASGLMIGAVSSLAAMFDGIIRIGLVVSTSAFAYYLTQVPFLGALTYSHGLVFFLFPIAVIGAWSILTRRREPSEVAHADQA